MIRIRREFYWTKKEFEDALYFKWKFVKKGTNENEKLIEHEKDHLDMANALGYSGRYCMREIAINFLGILSLNQRQPQCEIECLIRPRDLRKICLAPENPSLSDKIIGSKLFSKIYSIYWRFKK